MNREPTIGLQVLRKGCAQEDLDRFTVEIARTMHDFQRIVAMRAMCFMAEQDCPFEEEFDGNDLGATHFIVTENGRDVASIRARWFAGFGKLERTCVLPSHRGTKAVRVFLAHACEVAARKGYRVMLAQIQARLWPTWQAVLNCKLRTHRPGFSFSDFDYLEMEIPLAPHPDAITIEADPYLIIRPEGAWDEAGVLDRSVARSAPLIQKDRAA